MRSEIIVSLRMAASAEAPSSPISLHPILQSMGKVGAVRGWGCQWALTHKQTLWAYSQAAAHLSWVIFVSLRMVASARAPLSPIVIKPRLRMRGKSGMVWESKRVNVS